MPAPFVSPELLAQAETRPTEAKLGSSDPVMDEEFKKLQGRVTRLCDNCKTRETETETRRDLRYMTVDVLKERESGHFDADEIYIPARVAHDNITKESAQYINYLTGSNNSAIFKPKQRVPNGIEMNPLENFFTKLVRYPGWEIPFFKVIDGTSSHGTDFIEVVFDSDKPGHFAFEHIAHDRLYFPGDLENIQKSPILIRVCKVTKDDLLGFKDINVEEVELLFKDKENVEQNESLAAVQKVYYRKQGVVYICWMDCKKNTTFLRAPKPLYHGRKKILIDDFTGIQIESKDIFETRYPIVCNPYTVSEDGRLSSVKGRVFFDEYIQEAVSSLYSAIVNGYHRASLIMASPKNPNVMASDVAQTNVVVAGGRVYNQALEFFHPDYPDPGGIQIANALLTQNKAETGQVNFAVGNRNDTASRKTATELTIADSQAAQLSGVQVTLFAIFLREVYTICWSIAQSQLEQGLLESGSDLDPIYLQFEYELYSAGDTEVLKRQETLQKLQAAYGVVANTPAGLYVLEDILSLAFPDKAARYIEALRMGDTKGQMLQVLVQVLSGIIQDNPGIIPAEEMPMVQAVLEQAQAASTQPAPVGQGQVTSESNNTAPTPLPNEQSTPAVNAA